MNVLPFDPEHVRAMVVQERQIAVVSHVTPEYLAALKQAGPAVTVEADGEPICCGGVATTGFGMGMLWAFVSAQAAHRLVRIDRVARRLLEVADLRRIEATTEQDFRQGCRWLELLGFQSEGIMRKYGPDGSDHVRYALVR